MLNITLKCKNVSFTGWCNQKRDDKWSPSDQQQPTRSYRYKQKLWTKRSWNFFTWQRKSSESWHEKSGSDFSRLNDFALTRMLLLRYTRGFGLFFTTLKKGVQFDDLVVNSDLVKDSQFKLGKMFVDLTTWHAKQSPYCCVQGLQDIFFEAEQNPF